MAPHPNKNFGCPCLILPPWSVTSVHHLLFNNHLAYNKSIEFSLLAQPGRLRTELIAVVPGINL